MSTTLTSVTTLKCSHCPYKTTKEESMHRHILGQECPNKSTSYRELN